MPSAPTRFTPRYVQAGLGNQVLSSTAAYVGGVLLTSKTAGASLNIYSRSNTSSVWNSTTERILRVHAKSPSATTTLPMVGPFLCPTGIGVSLNGVGSVATIFIAFKNK
mgnify:CR=1 FL=1